MTWYSSVQIIIIITIIIIIIIIKYSHLLSYFSGLELSKLAVNSSIFCDCKEIDANADLNTDIDSSTLILINVIN